MILSIFLWRHLLDLAGSIEHAQYQDECTDIERPDDRVRNNALRGHIAETDGREDEGEQKAHHGTSITEERLDAVGLGLLFFVDHIAHQHLERLHGHIDAGIEQHQGYQSEDQSRTHRHTEGTGIGQQTHDGYGQSSANEQIRYATSETAPRLITQRAYNRLHQDTHQWWQYPEETQVVGVSSQRTENT